MVTNTMSWRVNEIKELKVEVEKLKQAEKKKMEEVERRAYDVLPKKQEQRD